MWWEGCTCGVHYNAMYFVDCEYTYSECVDLRVWKSYGFIEFKDRAGKNFHWCVAHFIFARQPVQWAAQPGSAQAAQAENHQLKICDVIGRDRGAPSAGEREVCVPSVALFQLLSLNIGRASPQSSVHWLSRSLGSGHNLEQWRSVKRFYHLFYNSLLTSLSPKSRVQSPIFSKKLP